VAPLGSEASKAPIDVRMCADGRYSDTEASEGVEGEEGMGRGVPSSADYGSGERRKLHSGVRAEPRPKTDLGEICARKMHLAMRIAVIF